MITIEFENGNIVIKGEREDFQALADNKIISEDLLKNGGLTMTSKNIVFKIITDIDKILSQVVGSNLITEYRSLFPEGVSQQHDKSFRGNLGMCVKNMDKFKKEFKFSDEVILAATKEMVERHVRKNKKDWIPQAHYFIYKKDRGSDLATECENLMNGTTTEQFSKWK